MRCRNGEPAFTSPIPYRRIASVRGVDAVNGFKLGGREGLVRCGVIELFRRVLRIWSRDDGVAHCDIAVAFPHGKGGVSEVPCTGEPFDGWWCKIGLRGAGGRRRAETNG